MATPISFSGLASGLNTSQIVSTMVNAERSLADPFTQQQSDLGNQKSVVDSLSSSLSSLGSFMQNLGLSASLQLRTATASDSHVSIAVSSGAQTAVHDVRVQQLATAQIATSRTFASSGAGAAGTGSVTIGVAGATPSTVSWTASDSLADIASKISGAGAGVSASVLFDGSTYRLVVASTKTGTANAATFTESGTALGLSDPANITVAANDAKLSIDGVSISRATNVIDDALPGVTLTAVSAQAATDPDTSVTVGVDEAGLASQLQTFVSDYNAIGNALSQQLAYQPNAQQQSPLLGDSTLVQLQSSMQALMTKSFGGMTADQLGLTLDEHGVLSLDQSKLQTAVASDPETVATLFARNGFAKAFSDLSDAYTLPGIGIFAAKSQGLTDQSNTLQTQIDQINSNADALQTQLQNQFNALEKAISQLQSQSAYLTKVLS